MLPIVRQRGERRQREQAGRALTHHSQPQQHEAGPGGNADLADRVQGHPEAVGELLDEDHGRHGQDGPAERPAQPAGGDPAGQPAADEAAAHRGGGDHHGQAPVEVDGGEVATQSSRGVHRDDEQRGADGHRHGQATQQGQGGHDEEAAPGADDARGQSDGTAVEQHPTDGQGRVVRRLRGPPPPDHGDGRGGHHHREGGEQQAAREVLAKPAAGIRADHPGGAEPQAGAPLHPSGPGMRDRRDGAGDAHDQQGGGDGLRGLQSRDVDEQGDRQDRAAAAEQAEGQADQHGEEDDKCGHRVPLSDGGRYPRGCDPSDGNTKVRTTWRGHVNAPAIRQGRLRWHGGEATRTRQRCRSVSR